MAERRARSRSRPNEIDDGLGLREVHLAVVIGAFGKFSGRRPRARPHANTFQHACANERASVTTDLDQVFAGITRRCAMHRKHHLIDAACRSRRSARTAAGAIGNSDGFPFPRKMCRQFQSRLRPETRINAIAPSPAESRSRQWYPAEPAALVTLPAVKTSRNAATHRRF